MKEKILITSALPYANGPLHFGHLAGAYLPGDCYARYERLRGNDVLYICGSDEYGIAITLSAEREGRTPRQHVDHYHRLHAALFQKLGFSFDHFSRTTWPGHVPLAQQFFLELLDNGWIEERTTDQLWSEEEQRFLADRYVEGTCPRCGFDRARGDECPQCGASYEATDLIRPRSKISGSALSRRPTKHWFLLLDRMKEKLTSWLETKPWKPNVKNFINGYIADMHPRAITRDSTWGVPVPLPHAEGKVLYVWFDAPIGYLSATKDWAENRGTPDRWKEYWCDPATKLVNFVGKDNIPFHAAIFPAMIMGQKQPYKLVDELPANEFLNLEGRKFNKSEGWYIDLEDFFSKFSIDQIRYTLAANAPETADADFCWRDFQSRCNAELVGKLGNFVHRTLTFLQTRLGGKVPLRQSLGEEDRLFLANVSTLVEESAEAYRAFRLRRAARILMDLAQLGNVYFDQKSPWKDAKSPETHSRMETTLSCCLHAVQRLALISSPIIPEAAQKIWEMLGYTGSLEKESWDEVCRREMAVGKELPPPAVIFQKVEDSVIEEEIKKLQERVREKAPEKTAIFAISSLESTEREDADRKDRDEGIASAISKEGSSLDALRSRSIPDEIVKVAENTAQEQKAAFSDFQKLDLRVAKILEAEPIAKSKKLLYLTIDLGEGKKRKIVSGIRLHYTPEDLIGKHVVVIANLEPATVMGVQSEGMLLAGSTEDRLEVLEVGHLPPGTRIS